MLCKTKTAIKCIVLVFGIILLATCDEEIPEGPPRVQVTEAVLSITMERTDFPQPTNFGNRYKTPQTLEWTLMIDYLVRFRLKVNNIFDETVDGLKWIDVKVRLWSTNRPEIDRTYTYHNFTEDTTLIVLHPAHTYYLYTADSLIWNQTFENGESIHETNPYHTFKIKEDSLLDTSTKEWIYFCDTTYTGWEDTVVAFYEPIQMKAQASVKIFKNYGAIESNVLDFTITYLAPTGFPDEYICPHNPPCGGGGGGR